MMKKITNLKDIINLKSGIPIAYDKSNNSIIYTKGVTFNEVESEVGNIKITNIDKVKVVFLCFGFIIFIE